MEGISGPFKASSTSVIRVYNFCENFMVIVGGNRIEGIVFCYFLLGADGEPAFDIGAVDFQGNFRHFRVSGDKVRFERYVMG